MKTRILVAIPIAGLVLAAMLIQGWVLAAFAVCMALMAQYEIVRAFDASGHSVVRLTSYAFSAALAVLFLLDFGTPPYWSIRWYDASTILSFMVAAVMVTLICAMFSRTQSFDGVSYTVFTLAYPQLFFACFYAMILSCCSGDDREAYIRTALALFILFIPPVLSDTVAYFWGRKFGKRKLCPSISPNKTVAGSVAGLAGGALGGLVVWFGVSAVAAPTFALTYGWACYIIMGAALAGISQLGDLAASYIKRHVGIKDFGKLLPGHGGILDRIDSTMFTMPVAALFVSADLVGLISVS